MRSPLRPVLPSERARLKFRTKGAEHHPGDTVEILDHLDVPKALSPHDTQHAVRLADAHFKLEPAAGDQGLHPLLGNGTVEVQSVLTAVQRQVGFIVFD